MHTSIYKNNIAQWRYMQHLHLYLLFSEKKLLTFIAFLMNKRTHITIIKQLVVINVERVWSKWE